MLQVRSKGADLSTLQCRIAFAQLVMRLELVARSFHMDVYAVEDTKGNGRRCAACNR